MILVHIMAWLALGMCIQPQPATEPAPQVIEIVAERYAFFPSRIRVASGATVEFHLRSDDTNHGFRLPALHINREIPKRGTDDLVLLVHFSEKGEYAFFCSKPCGAGHNMMRGLVIVD